MDLPGDGGIQVASVTCYGGLEAGGCERRIEVIVKIQKSQRVRKGDLGGCVRCVRRIDFFCENKNSRGGGGQGGCEGRFEVIVKMQKLKSREWGPVRGRAWSRGVR